MQLTGFSVCDFPLVSNPIVTREGSVYIFCLSNDDGTEIPFYVGQTDRFLGRMNDYKLACFSASTDFCVGEAAKYFMRTKKRRVVVRYRPSPNPRQEEGEFIRLLLAVGVKLLNHTPRYNYLTANPGFQRRIVQGFCDTIA